MGDFVNNLNLTDELILTIFNELSNPSKEIKIPKTFIQKILFKLKNDFEEDKTLVNSIPFYWYNHGPFSEPIRDSLNKLVSEDFLKIDPVNEYYVLNKDIRLRSNDYEEDIIKLLRKFSIYNLEKLIDDVYFNDAPFEFIPLYKREMLEPLEKKIAQSDKEYFKESIDLDELIDLLYDCESELPFDPIFNGYSRIFSNFTSILDNIYEEIDYINFIKSANIIKLMWYTFTKGLRIAEHEDAVIYNIQEISWKEKYFSKIAKTEKDMEFLKDIERESCKNEYIIYPEKSKNLLLSTVGTYLFD